ncbi:hypothetical protein ACKWTF_014308 [Chironomus riparius]
MNFLCLTILSTLALIFPVQSSSGDVSCDKSCPKWEVYSRCAGPNQPNCFHRHASTDESQCIPGCVCTRGMIRDPNTFKCISEHKCPNPVNNPKWCPINEVYSDCSAGCQRTCDTLNAVFKCRCIPGCICRDGYVRSQITNQCVPIKSCKGCPKGYKRNPETGNCEFQCNECPKNEEYKDCGSHCEPDCFPRAIACILSCKQGCFCKTGYVRGPQNGTCIPKDKCPKCPANESFSCGNPLCEKTCENYKETCTIQNIRCEDKCYCNDGFVRNKNNVCVPVSECDENDC